MEKLKPCPFCGGTPYMAQNYLGQKHVRCPECGACVWGRDTDDWSVGKMGEKQAENAAAEAWNRRAERSFSPVMPITNADRIRQMSDDELATLFGDACACLYDDADVCEKWGGACDRCWLDWLKQEAERSEDE